MRKSIRFFIFLFLINYSYSLALDKDEVFNKLKSLYSGLETISFDFSSNSKFGLSASLIAKKGNKYRITMDSREIYCDSKTIWNYSIRDNNVLISTFKDINNNSLEQVFFNFIKNYSPINLYKENNTKGKEDLILELQANDPKNSIYDKINLSIDNKLIINGIVLFKNYQKESFNINNIKLNEKIDDKYFEFNKKNKDKLEIIDLR